MSKVISNYPLPIIDSILACFNGCKFFSAVDLRSGYYHICLTKEAAEKKTFITDKGKWIFLSLPLGINIGCSGFSCVLGKVLAQCTEFVLKYLDDIMIFSKMGKIILCMVFVVGELFRNCLCIFSLGIYAYLILYFYFCSLYCLLLLACR